MLWGQELDEDDLAARYVLFEVGNYAATSDTSLRTGSARCPTRPMERHHHTRLLGFPLGDPSGAGYSWPGGLVIRQHPTARIEVFAIEDDASARSLSQTWLTPGSQLLSWRVRAPT